MHARAKFDQLTPPDFTNRQTAAAGSVPQLVTEIVSPLAARFEAPADVTVAMLRVELFFPKDDASARFFTDQRTEPPR